MLKIVDKKALSPIFATLIILAVVTALFVPVFIWATSTSVQSQDIWGGEGMAAKERIVVEEVNLVNGQPCVIYVRNIGETAVTPDNIFIITPTGSTYTFERTKNEFTTTTPEGATRDSAVQGDLLALTISNVGFQVLQDTSYTIKVFTTRSVGDQYTAVA